MSEERREKIGNASRKRMEDPEIRRVAIERLSHYSGIGMKGKHHTEETKNLFSKLKKGKPLSESHIAKLKLVRSGEGNVMWGKHHTEETKKKIGEKSLGREWSEESRKKVGDRLRGVPRSAETIQKMREKMTGKPKSEAHREKIVEHRIGGFWYGNVRNDKRKYCELWGPDLWRRIDAFQNNRSILSKKTKKDNGGRALTRHHVYWQPKACCEWDEDEQGYFAMINIGTLKKPNMYRYYVGEDPNKFVLLTDHEHGLVKKDKLTWIRRFEKLIDQKYGGKCFYTKEEWALMNPTPKPQVLGL